MLRVIKNTGKKENFNTDKIRESLIKALSEADVDWDLQLVGDIITLLIAHLEEQNKNDEVETSVIRDTLLYILNAHPKGLRKVSNAYKRHEKVRDIDRALKGVYESLSNDDTEEKTENANVNAYNPAGRLLHIAEDVTKIHARNKIFSKDVIQAVDDGKIYIHDMNWTGTGSTTCCQIDLEQLLNGGFHTGHGFLREPGSIQSAFQLAAIAIQANQNDQHGGRAVLWPPYMVTYS